MIKRVAKTILACFIVLCAVIPNSGFIAQAKEVEETSEQYTIYPKPQNITYDGNSYILKDVNVIYDEEIDDATKQRFDEVMALKGLEVKVSNEAAEGKTNIYVGVYRSNGAADTYIQNKYAPEASLFEETDSYFLKSDDDVIAVLGKDTDASFYGLTSLYHVFTQLDSLTISNFTIQDYSDIEYRGFIEGYYGGPWSNDDREELMTFGGYYKMNQYVFAPKDDPYHNKQWRELYPEENLKTIKKLAQAGNASKCRYVWTIHPFMNNSFNFNKYENDIAIIEAKFDQLLASDVRQFGVLADDANGVSVENTNRLLSDLTAFLETKKAEYPDLNTNILYCPAEYYYDTNALSKYSVLPENVKVVTTGGQIWGEVDNSYLKPFTESVGRKSYMWINWPCTDNSSNHLIMGGYADFLHPGVNKEYIQGTILNPMQQSEPSKVAIFGNAAYSWNIWDTEAEANQAWDDSFSFVDHNSAIETDASKALRELSKHMINQAMDSRVRVLQESVDLKEILNPIKAKFANESFTLDDLETVNKEFQILQDAAKTYRAQGNEKMLGDLDDYVSTNSNEQIGPWIDCWDDTTTAAMAYIQAMKDYKNGNVTSMLSNYSKAQEAFAASKNIEIMLLDSTRFVEAGVQHIVPFIKEMDSYVSRKVKEIADPNALTFTYVSDVFTTPYIGNTEYLFDGDDATYVEFHSPNTIYKNNYVGTTFNRTIDVNSIRIVSAGGKNHFYHISLQYTRDKETWIDIPNASFERPKNSEEAVVVEGLDLKNVLGIRMIATADNETDSWLTISAFDINKATEDDSKKAYEIKSASLENSKIASNFPNNTLEKAYDGDIGTEAFIQNKSGADNIPANAAIVVDLGEMKSIGSIYFYQGKTSANDIISQGLVEYSNDLNTWKTFGSISGKNEETISGAATARYIRIRNTETKNVWWRFGEIQVFPAKDDLVQFNVVPIGTRIATHNVINDSAKNNKLDYLVDGDDTTLGWLASTNPDNGNIQNGNGFDVAFGKDIELKQITLLQATDDKVSDLKFQYKDTDGWKDLKVVTDAQANVVVDASGITANTIRITNHGTDTKHWWKVYDVKVEYKSTSDQNNVYTNVESNTLSSITTEKEVYLTNGDITLAKDEYIGLNLGSIQSIAAIDASVQTKTKTAPVLEASLNGKVWTSVHAGTQTNTKAQYIRFRNATDMTETYTIEQLRATLKLTATYGKLVSSDISSISGWGDTRGNGYAFDSSMTTVEKFGGLPLKGNTAVFDFGQDIDVNSVRVYTQDTQKDFIRDAIIQLSSDGITWEDAFTIGDGVKDTFGGTFGEYVDENKKTDTNYPNVIYYGNDELQQNARYLRIYLTADYPDRALAINSIMLNKGAYISLENNAAFDGTQEAKGHLPSNMLDGDLTTTYRPSKSNGSMTYNLSNAEQVRAIRLIQSGSASEASVTATVFDTTKNQVMELPLGTLAQAINEFNLPKNCELLSTTISWKDKLPDISEIITMNFDSDPTDARNNLKEIIEKHPDNYAAWTKNSSEAYDEMLRLAKEIYDSPQASATTLNNAANSLQNLVSSATIKANQTKLDALQKLLAEQMSNDKKMYTTVSYQVYTSAISKVMAAIEDKDNVTDNIANEAISAVQTAKDGLLYSTFRREIAELSITSFTAINKDTYSMLSYHNLKESYDEMMALIQKDKAATTQQDRISPEVFDASLATFAKNEAALYDISELKAAMDVTKTEALYTADTWKAYADAQKAAIDAILNAQATNDDLDACYTALIQADQALTLVSNVDLRAYIEDLKAMKTENYTEASYQALVNAIDKAIADLVANDDDVNLENKTKLITAKNELISIVALQAKLEELAKLDKAVYTKDSYALLEKELGCAEQIKATGSAKDISDFIENISNATKNLVLNAGELDAYRNKQVYEIADTYTKDSYDAYKLAYEALMALESGNTPLETFQTAKENYEKAASGLTIQLADYAKVNELKNSIPSDLSSYTDETVNALQDVLLELDTTLDVTKQEAVDRYATKLQTAIAALKLKNQDQGGNEDTPDSPSMPDGTTDSDKEHPGEDKPQTDKDTNHGANTGDTSNQENLLMMFVLAGSLCAVLMLKRMKQHQ